MAPLAPSNRYTAYEPVVATTEFPVGFPIFDNSDLALLHNGEAISFTVTATYDADSVSTDAVCVVSAGITGLVEVVGLRSPRRTDQYTPGQPLPLPNHNYSLNRLTAEDQEQRRDIDRSLKFDLSVEDADTRLPPHVPGKVLGWDIPPRLTNFTLPPNGGADAVIDNEAAVKALDPERAKLAFLPNATGFDWKVQDSTAAAAFDPRENVVLESNTVPLATGHGIVVSRAINRVCGKLSERRATAARTIQRKFRTRSTGWSSTPSARVR